jgi:hypothetical protein
MYEKRVHKTQRNVILLITHSTTNFHETFFL